MGKQELKQRETQVATGDGVGKQLEQTFTVDDNCLPSPQELAALRVLILELSIILLMPL